jgi:outer membrane lipoprotein LolB
MYEIACLAKRRDFVVGTERGHMAVRHSLTPVATSAALLLFLLISGCATRQSLQLPDLTDWDTRIEVLAGLDDWEFSGRVGISTETDGFDGKLRWIQDGDKFQATVSGKLGIGAIRVEGDGRSAVLTDKDGVKTELEDAEIDLQYRYGWTIPVESLRYWALGIPDPVAEPVGQFVSTFNAEGQLETLQQRGWLVTISRYKEGGGQLMPSRLSAVNPDTKVRLVIDQWVFLD